MKQQNLKIGDIYGKIPPQAIDFEEMVLGATLLEKDAYNQISDVLTSDSFYKEQHKLIFEACKSLNNKRLPIDLLSVVQELKSAGRLEEVGGAYYISTLTNKVTSLNVTYHARIIQQQFLKRRIIEEAHIAMEKAYDDTTDVFEVLQQTEKGISSIQSHIGGGSAETMNELWAQILERNKKILNNNGVSGVPSGYVQLDKITGGWQETDLIIIAGRPAMGKTSFMLNLARNAGVLFEKQGAIFSLEMSNVQLGTRLVSLESSEPIYSFARRGLNDGQIAVIEKEISKLICSKMYFDDSSAVPIQQIKQKARQLKKDKGIKWLIIDYLQLAKGGEKSYNRDTEIGEITSGLKALAKELEIPIIALSQLSRQTEAQGNKKPSLAHLRESGNIEQDADMVLFLHRPEYYGINEFPEPLEETGSVDTKGVMEVIIAKHRNGATGSVYLGWDAKLTKVSNLSEPKVVMANNDKFLEQKKDDWE